MTGRNVPHPMDESGQMDETELALFRDALRGLTATTTGAALDAALSDVGWVDALALDERAAVSALFEEQGVACATSGSLGRVVLHALGIDAPVNSSVLLPRLGAWNAPADPVGGAAALGLGDLRRTTTALVVDEADGRARWTALDVTDLDLRAVTGIDPAAELVAVRLDAPGSAAGPAFDDLSWSPAQGSWNDAVAAARRALAHEQVGAMRTMLDLARTHALERVQFGQPIARFQAVRHRLAEAFVAIESATAALDGAWLDGSPFTATVAKAVAGTSAREVRRHCQQVLAGIGFTTEHDLHTYVRRSILLDGLFGDAATLTDQIGAHLIAAGELPDLLPL